jgi:hypothetical protein
MNLLRRLSRFVGHILWLGSFSSMMAALALNPALSVPPLTVVSSAGLPPSGTPGISVRGGMGARETTAQIMARQASQGKIPQPAVQVNVNHSLDLTQRKPNPSSEGLLQAPSISSPTSVLAITQLYAFLPNAINFDGPDYNANPCGTPPDTMGAVGPTQFIVAVNCKLVSYNKTTGVADGVLDTTPDVFFSSVRSASSSDPHIRYDRTSGRWFIVMIDVAFPNNRILLAVSGTATITAQTNWTFFYFQNTFHAPNSCLADYPTPGIDASAIYIGINQFCGPSLSTVNYLTSDGFVVQKSSVLGAGPIFVTAFLNLVSPAPNYIGPYTPQGVDNPDPAASEGYFIGVDGGTTGLLDLRRVSNPGSASPTISGNVTITTALQASPNTQPHLGNTNPLGGTTGQLDASDGRLFAAYLRNGSLWTTLDSGVNSSCTASGSITRDAVFWYELSGIHSGSSPSVKQAGAVCDISATNPAFYSYGTIMVNGQGHAALGFTIAGANNYTTPGIASRLAGDPAGTLGPINVLVAGSHPYNPSFDKGGSNGRRWGDYSYTSLDPCNDMTLWTIQEYASSNNIYGMRVAQLQAPPPANPATAGSVPAGLASVDVTISGTSAGGSGFYDTPADLTDACRTRIQASVSGGVAVNSVTYTDPTHVTLDLSTIGAAAGLQNVTITNPDGQSATGMDILNVTAIQPAPTTLVLGSSLNPSTYGEMVQFTATVSSTSGTPNGSVSFIDGMSPLGTVMLSAGVASLSTPALVAGPHTITATYGGNTSFASSSGALGGVQTVNPASTSLSLSSSANPSIRGYPVTYTATVTSSPGLVPTGLVTLTIDGIPSAVALDAGGTATLTIDTLAAGAHAVNASFAGSANFAASVPASLTQTVLLAVYLPVIIQ